MTLFSLILLGKSPDIIFSYLSEIQSGTSVFLVAVFFSLSFFLGRVAEHFIIAVNYFCRKSKRQGFVDSFIGTKEEIWGNKIFFFSSALGLLAIMLFLLAEYRNELLAILIIGVILLIATASSFIYWYKFGGKFELNTLRKEKKMMVVAEELRDMPLEKLERIRRFIEETKRDGS